MVSELVDNKPNACICFSFSEKKISGTLALAEQEELSNNIHIFVNCECEILICPSN